MSVSLYYSAHRDTPLSDAERAGLGRIIAEGESALTAFAEHALPAWVRDGEVTDPDLEPRELFEPLAPYSFGGGRGELFAGSSKISHTASGPEPQMAQLNHYLAALARLRDAVPGAEWRVRIDDLAIPWVDGEYDLGSAGH
ncbi:hypothetical protein [Nocardiopsis sp. SBT366]|uniref:hypothetical protein n=1 Tax=Nocardiopsis sp. SBT366 TaxID=1580529 RepID=UPI00066B7820|nr:hypothetical protein [Nocardiopsis sp. SBT366]